MMNWGPSSRQIDVACTIRVGQHADSLHAHMELDALEINPGDIVQLIEARPESLGAGETVYQARATVTRAGPLARALTKLAGFFQILELIEVGFEPKEVK